MSKQSNQRYRKVKERDDLKKAGGDVPQSDMEKKSNTKDKINHTFGDSAEKE